MIGPVNRRWLDRICSKCQREMAPTSTCRVCGCAMCAHLDAPNTICLPCYNDANRKRPIARTA